jgi:hypothetical protein
MLFFPKLQELPFTVTNDQEQDEEQQDNDGQRQCRKRSVQVAVDEEDRTQQDGDLDEAGESGQGAKDEQDTAEDLRKGDIIAHEHGGERAKGHPVGDEIEHSAHIHEEIDSLITEKGSQGNPDQIQPLGMMGIAPVFNTLYEVHMASFK